VLKKSNRIHEDRWRMLSSIESKLVQEMQSSVFKRRRNKKESEETLQAKSLLKFNDLIQIKHLELESDTCKRDKIKNKLFASKVNKKPYVLSRTQPSSQNPLAISEGAFRNPWKLFSQSFGRLSAK
jgi:hypothetical protein